MSKMAVDPEGVHWCDCTLISDPEMDPDSRVLGVGSVAANGAAVVIAPHSPTSDFPHWDR